MEISYSQCGDYLIPNLVLPEEEQQPIGKYGRMRKRYLKDHRPVMYSSLLLSGELHQHLYEIDQACADRIELITQQMKVQEDVTETLKAVDQMEWVRRMNSIQNRAEEIVLSELVYC
ncbi:MAG: TnpV protein [Oscillospiraceae bacterium]|nr:TnpV protein [Oscillospiraceae bacterium]